ncbi:MAG: ribbon-helix-helix domain-containing protein [Candidatus Gastranaerophilales bacterium]|nr:ribbon-helix-helix domain-containing protein [Candidatus Gastranaerophilales bacterium]
MGIKKGTRLTDTPKSILYQIRVDEETDGKVKEICEREGISKSELIRQGIDLKYRNLETANQ